MVSFRLQIKNKNNSFGFFRCWRWYRATNFDPGRAAPSPLPALQWLKWCLQLDQVGAQAEQRRTLLVITADTFQIQGNRSWTFQKYNLPLLRQASQWWSHGHSLAIEHLSFQTILLMSVQRIWSLTQNIVIKVFFVSSWNRENLPLLATMSLLKCWSLWKWLGKCQCKQQIKIPRTGPLWQVIYDLCSKPYKLRISMWIF